VPGGLAGALARARPNVRERAPEEYQDGKRDGDALGWCGAEGAQQSAQHQIEQDVIGLFCQAEAGGLSAFDQLSKPGVIKVARKIAGLNARLPEAGNQHEDRRGDGGQQARHTPGFELVNRH